MSTRWTEAQLAEYRKIGDPEVDDLVEELIPKDGSESIGRLGYNYMVELADELLDSGEPLQKNLVPRLGAARRTVPRNDQLIRSPLDVQLSDGKDGQGNH